MNQRSKHKTLKNKILENNTSKFAFSHRWERCLKKQNPEVFQWKFWVNISTGYLKTIWIKISFKNLINSTTEQHFNKHHWQGFNFLAYRKCVCLIIVTNSWLLRKGFIWAPSPSSRRDGERMAAGTLRIWSHGVHTQQAESYGYWCAAHFLLLQ